MKFAVFFKTLVFSVMFLTSVVAQEQVITDETKEKGLEHTKANEIEAIEFSISVERSLSDFNKEIWEQMISDGKNLITLCKEKGYSNEWEKDYFFVNKLGDFIEKYFPIVSENKTSIDGYLGIQLLGEHVDTEILNNSEWTKVINQNVDIDNAKKITFNFIIQRYKEYDAKIWQNIFDTARDYAVSCQNSSDIEFESHIARFRSILKETYDYSKGTKVNSADLNISVVNTIEIE